MAKKSEPDKEHVHGPGCGHEHHHEPAEHVHGPGCGHEHHDEHEVHAHVHGPGCGHDHHHEEAEHVHGPGCGHEQHDEHEEHAHVHGPGCGHDHHHEAAEHVHGPGCGHEQHDEHEEHAHVHGPGCGHDHHHQAEPHVHVHGPDCGHEHHLVESGHVHVHHAGCGHRHVHTHRQEHPPTNRPAETGGPACQLDLPSLIPGEYDEFGRTQQLERMLEAKKGVLDVHVRRDLGRSELCVHYDPKHFRFDQIVGEVRKLGADVAKRCLQKTWFVRGMESAQCGYTIEHALGKKTNGILSAEVAYAAERLVVEYDSDVISADGIVQRVRAIGYLVEEPEQGHACAFHAGGGGLAPKLEMPLVIAAGVLIAAGLAVEGVGIAPGLPLLSTVLYAAALVSGGLFAVRGALKSLRQGIVDIETLMVLAAVGACFLGAWFEGAFLLFLFSLGHGLEHRAMDKARRAIEALTNLRPETARVKRADAVVEVSVTKVLRGDIMVIRPGDRLPLDGTIRSGQSSIDQATITGESVPVARGPGDEVFASTINVEAVLEVEVTRLSTESVLARIVDMVAEAEAQKSPTQRFAKRLERTFVPVVLAAAPILTLVLIAIGTGFTESVLRGISLLVAASPCALAISTPAAVLSAVARAARGGVLIKGGAYLEALGKLNAIAFDKTGTLTLGRPRVMSVKPEAGINENELVAAAACVEAHSSHPIAYAILEAASERQIARVDSESCVAVHGKGLRAMFQGDAVWAGNLPLFEGQQVPESVLKKVSQLEESGQTTVVVKRGDRFLGVIGVADKVRSESRKALEALKRIGVGRTIMLSGDNHRVARAVGAEVGIDEAKAPLMPDGKVKALRELARDGNVAMVGDGVNDAPALAAASVGIAMGGAGSDVALETADVVLMSDDLSRLSFAVALSRQASRVIRQNLVISLGVSAILVLATIFGWVQISEAVIFHEGSTLLVVANGLRLLAFRGGGNSHKKAQKTQRGGPVRLFCVFCAFLWLISLPG
jgi:Cd2+/Zn2+-exporting ATPase